MKTTDDKPLSWHKRNARRKHRRRVQSIIKRTKLLQSLYSIPEIKAAEELLEEIFYHFYLIGMFDMKLLANEALEYALKTEADRISAASIKN